MQRSGRDEDRKTWPPGRGQARREAIPPGPTSRVQGKHSFFSFKLSVMTKFPLTSGQLLPSTYIPGLFFSSLSPAAPPLVVSSPCIFSLLESQGTEPRTLLLLFLVSSLCLPGHVSMGSGRSGCLCTFCVLGAGTTHRPVWVSWADSRAMQGTRFLCFSDLLTQNQAGHICQMDADGLQVLFPTVPYSGVTVYL